MVATAVPVTKPMALWPGSKELVEAGALLPAIHVAGLNCPQVAEKHEHCPHSPLTVPYLPPQRESPIAASGTGGASP